MKKAILVLLLVSTLITSYPQADTTPARTKQFYLTRSRHQKTAAWIMLGGVVVLTGVGLVGAAGSSLDYALGDRKANTTMLSIFLVTGFASTLGSIPMFIIAGNNKHKAASLSLNMQQVPMLFQSNRFTAFRQPASQ